MFDVCIKTPVYQNDPTLIGNHVDRVWAMETAGLQNEIGKQHNHSLEMNSPSREAMAFASLHENSNSVDLLRRYETPVWMLSVQVYS